MKHSSDLLDNKKQYKKMHLTKKNLVPDAIEQFEMWLTEAKESKLPDYNAMCLSTIDTENKPHSRIVLLRGLDKAGFVFYTNYNSLKAANIAANTNVFLHFFWSTIERQVRIEGTAIKTSKADAEQYFSTRPRASQISAWASPQSKVIKDRKALEQLWEKTKNQFDGQKKIPKPPFWGGYKVMPEKIEFWQGGNHRLHDRLRYTKLKNNLWKIERLAP